MVDQANEKKIEAMNALSEGDILFSNTYSRTLFLVLLQKWRWISWTILNALEEEKTYFLLDTQNYLEHESFFKYCFSNIAIV